MWHLYLLECEGGRWYAGIALDVAARFCAHREGKGAKFTRGFRPIRILATRPYPTRSDASKAEHQLKKLPKKRKLDFMRSVEEL